MTTVLGVSWNPHLRGIRGAVLAAAVISGATTAVIALLPELHASYRWSALHVALESAASLVALLAAFLVVGRFRRRTFLDELMLVSGLAVLALSDLFFGTLPIVDVPSPAGVTVWASLAGSMLGALLFALAAIVPRHRLHSPTFMLAGGTAWVTAALALAIALISALIAPVPQGLSVARRTLPLFHAGAVQPGPQLVMAALYALAAIGFLRRSQQWGDEFLGWLAIAAVLHTASCVDYSLYPALNSDSVYIAEAFRLLFYAVLFVGSMREIWSYWRALSEAAVLEERRRLARDLHDGLAQELAYLARNLQLLDAHADSETISRLRRAVERAQTESLSAIRALAAPSKHELKISLAEAVGEIAERFHVDLEFDSAPDVRLPDSRAEALVRIACEAVTNAARHSGASRVCLSLTRDGQRVRLRVSDTGCGFNPDAQDSGFGLTSLRERAHSVGGELRISSTVGRGSEVEAVL